MANPTPSSVSDSVEARGGADTDGIAFEEVRLVVSAQGGDSQAFGDLVRLYQRRAVAVAYRFVGNSTDAADVAQDAFVRAFRKLDQLDEPQRFGAWLMRIVTNLSLNFRRSRASSQAVSLEDGMESAADGGDRPGRSAPPSGERTSQADELKGAIAAALDQLPDKQRAALVLFSIEKMPQKEVARILDCSLELVKWNVFQARKKLKELLKEHI